MTTWYRLFSTFAPYDDEGCFLITAREVARGGELYDEVHSLYGPAFALSHAGLHRLFGLPFENRVARWKTLVVLLAAASAGAWLVWRGTGSRVLSAAGGLLTLHHIEKFAAEPGHPQDLAVLLVLLILGLGLRIGDGRSWTAVSIGACVGFLAMLKLNLAVFVAVPLAVVLTAGAGWRRVSWLAVLACIGIGPAVTSPDLDQPAVWWLLAAAGSGLVATAIAAVARPPRIDRAWSAMVEATVAATSVVAGWCAVALALEIGRAHV